MAVVGLGGGSPAYSSISGATGINTIDNTNFAQNWNWSTATTQNAMSIAGNALTTGSLLNLTSSSATLNSTNGLLNVANTSASTTGAVARIQSNSTAGSGLTVLANGNVGVGTATPTAPLTVRGDQNLLNSAGNEIVRLTSVSDRAKMIMKDDSGNLLIQFNTHSGDGPRIYSESSSNKLDGAQQSFGANLWLVTPHVTGEENGIFFGSGGNIAGSAITYYNANNASYGNGGLKFKTSNAGNVSTRMTIDTTGNVGIGTTSPNRLLEVAGPVRISPTALPGAPAAGDIAVDSGDGNKLKVHNGTSWLTATSTANGTANKIPKYTAANTLGDSAMTDDGSRITATRSIAAITNSVAAATVNLNLSNTHTLNTVGGAAITIQNPSNGGVYNIVVTDATSRTYTFSGCTASYFRPANGPTTAATRTIYGLMTIDNGAGGWDCYITWSSGFQ